MSLHPFPAQLAALSISSERISEAVSQIPVHCFATPTQGGEWSVSEILLHLLRAHRFTLDLLHPQQSTERSKLPVDEQSDFADPQTRQVYLIAFASINNELVTLFSRSEEAAWQETVVFPWGTFSRKEVLFNISGHVADHVVQIRSLCEFSA